MDLGAVRLAAAAARAARRAAFLVARPAQRAARDRWPAARGTSARHGAARSLDRRHRGRPAPRARSLGLRSEEHTSELQSLMPLSYAVFRLTTKKHEYQPPPLE